MNKKIFSIISLLIFASINLFGAIGRESSFFSQLKTNENQLQLLNAISTNNFPQIGVSNVYFSVRTDGRTNGAGTLQDPLDASTPAKFNYLQGLYWNNINVYLLSGDYVVTNNWGIASNFKLTGIGNTWIHFDPTNAPQNGRAAGFNLIETLGNNSNIVVDNIKFHGHGEYVHATKNTNVIGFIGFNGQNIIIKNCEGWNPRGNWVSGTECFSFYSWRQNTNNILANKILNTKVFIESTVGTNASYINAITVGVNYAPMNNQEFHIIDGCEVRGVSNGWLHAAFSAPGGTITMNCFAAGFNNGFYHETHSGNGHLGENGYTRIINNIFDNVGFGIQYYGNYTNSNIEIIGNKIRAINYGITVYNYNPEGLQTNVTILNNYVDSYMGTLAQNSFYLRNIVNGAIIGNLYTKSATNITLLQLTNVTFLNNFDINNQVSSFTNNMIGNTVIESNLLIRGTLGFTNDVLNAQYANYIAYKNLDKTYNANIYIDFETNAFQTITFTGDATLHTTNRIISTNFIKNIKVKLVPSGANRTITFNSDWKRLDSTPASLVLTNGKIGILELVIYPSGTAEADVIANYKFGQ